MQVTYNTTYNTIPAHWLHCTHLPFVYSLGRTQEPLHRPRSELLVSYTRVW